jgi:hypothetical protein
MVILVNTCYDSLAICSASCAILQAVTELSFIICTINTNFSSANPNIEINHSQLFDFSLNSQNALNY